jgi:hypothetical protein
MKLNQVLKLRFWLGISVWALLHLQVKLYWGIFKKIHLAHKVNWAGLGIIFWVVSAQKHRRRQNAPPLFLKCWF